MRSLTEQERQQFAQQYRTGQFTGKFAADLWKLSDEAQYTRTQTKAKAKTLADNGDIHGAVQYLATHGYGSKAIRDFILPYVSRASQNAGAIRERRTY